MKNHRGLLQLEGLTERIVPAVSIRTVDGDLVISGIANTVAGKQHLEITVTGNDQINIVDGTTSRGKYAVTGDLILNLSNRADEVTIDFTGAFTLSGGITANLNNGNDSLEISNLTGAADATIAGDITVDGGNGSDTFTITNSSKLNTTLSISGAVTFNGGAGVDTMNANTTTLGASTAAQVAALAIGDGMVMTRVNIFNVGTGGNATGGDYTTPVTIDGNLIFNASIDKLVGNTVTMGNTTNSVTVAGALTLTGGQGTDTVTWENVNVVDVIPAEDTVLEVSVNLGLGANKLALTTTQIGISGTDADFSFTGGTGNDTVDLTGGGNSISGTVTVTLGNGTNVYTDSDTVYDKNVTITGGKTVDTITMDQAVISGLLSVSLGAGTNGLDISGAASSIAGGLSYVGGSGVDTLNITTGDDLAGDVSISLGTGADTLTFTGFTSGNETITSITIDLGVDSAIDTVNYSLDLSTDGIWTDPLNLGFNDVVTPV